MTWPPPTGDPVPGMPPPQSGPPPPVRPRPAPAAIAGQPLVLVVDVAAGVGFVGIETDAGGNLVTMAPIAGEPTARRGELAVPDGGAFRYRFVWRSSWNGGTTDWTDVTPS